MIRDERLARSCETGRMNRFRTIAALLTTLLAVLPTPAAPAPEGATGELAQRLLDAHNRERAMVGAPPLQWDSTLAAHAASYGPVLASLRHLVHSPREGRPGERENLAMAWHGTMSPEQLVSMWTSEKRLLQPGLFPAVSRTGQWEDVAHYTQMVWQRRPVSVARSSPSTGTIWCAAIRRQATSMASQSSPRRPPHPDSPAAVCPRFPGLGLDLFRRCLGRRAGLAHR